LEEKIRSPQAERIKGPEQGGQLMDSQQTFLATIRKSLGLPPAEERSKTTYPDLFRQKGRSEVLSRIRQRTPQELDKLVEILLSNAKDLNISASVVASHDEAAAVIADLVKTKNLEFTPTKHIVHHDHPDLNALQLWKYLEGQEVTVHTTFGPDKQLREKTIASFIGITAPAIGVAESATLVQLTKPGQPRSTSLVPSIHIAVLDRKNLVANLAEAYALLKEMTLPNSFVCISGPSKTADIEATMVHGAHGPRELHLLVLSPPTAENTVDTNIPEAGKSVTFQEE
jgi:L-lactate dehydrogenase complex protein LldG